MVKSELNSVSFRDKLSRAIQLIQEDLNHSVEMFNSALIETATEMTKTVKYVGLPKQTIKCPGLIMNAGHKSVKLVKSCVHS